MYGYWKGEHPAPASSAATSGPRSQQHHHQEARDGWLWFIPLGNGERPRVTQISVGFVAPRNNLPEAPGKAALEKWYLDRVHATAEWKYLLSDATYTGRVPHDQGLVVPQRADGGPGYFAVGDAACFVDPILSSGAYLAILYAKMARSA